MNIDREIAEKVMGYVLMNDGTIYDNRGEKPERIDSWNPSTNIQHAMEVEAEMFRRGFCIQHNRGTPQGQYSAWFYISGKEKKTGKFGDSLPEAICLAALEAVE